MAEDTDQAKEMASEMAGKEEAEPWEKWETKLVLYSVGIGILVLVVGGLLINMYLL